MVRGKLSSEDVINSLSETLKEAKPIETPTSLGEESKVIGETYNNSLEDAANLLLSMLQPALKNFSMELADITLKIPRWQLLLGSLVSQHECGTLTAPSIDPSWRQVEAIIGKSICGECQKEFTPKRIQQKYCSQECGEMVRKREMEKRHEKQRKEEERIVNMRLRRMAEGGLSV